MDEVENVESLNDTQGTDSEPEVTSEPTPLLGKKVRAKGSRQAVWDGDAMSTSGGLKKEDLFLDEKTGAIKSKKASELSKQIATERKSTKSSTPVKKQVKVYEEARKAEDTPAPKKAAAKKAPKAASKAAPKKAAAATKKAAAATEKVATKRKVRT